MKYLQLHSGDVMPALGLGTWRAGEGVLTRAIQDALRIGYRHIDCAYIYGNEKEAGEVFATTDIPREELFITSKLWNNMQEPESVRPALESSLNDLRLNYLDLYLIHWPVHLRRDVKYPERAEHLIAWTSEHMLSTWRELEKAVDEGLVRNIGFSNFSTKKIQIIIDNSRVKPAVSQVEMHPYQQQNIQRTFCKQHGMALTGFAPLGSGNRPPERRKENEPNLLGHEVILDIASKHSISAGQVLLSWAMMRGTSVIPKSTNPERMQQNFDAADLSLDTEDLMAIAALDMGYRYFDGSHWMLDGAPYSKESLWDGE